jgi:hypothetical protein
MASQANRDIMLLSGMIAIAITISLFLRWMNLLTEKHWTLSENTMRPWRIHWRSLTRDVFEIGYSHFITGPQDTLEVCDAYRRIGAILITFWTMIKRPYRPHGFVVGDDSANSSWLLPST